LSPPEVRRLSSGFTEPPRLATIGPNFTFRSDPPLLTRRALTVAVRKDR
jgi:hypothetical protein